MAFGTLMAVVIGIGYFYLTPPLYEADIVIGLPLYQDLGDEQGSSLGQVLLPRSFRSSSQDERYHRFIDVLSSLRVAQKLMDRLHAERTLFGDEWDSATETWHPPAGWFDRLSRRLGSMLGIEVPWSPPDAVRFAQYVRHNIAVNNVFGAQNTKIQAWNADPVFLRSFMTGLIQAAQEVMREDAEKYYSNELSSIDRARAKAPQLFLRDNLRDLEQKANQNLLLTGAGQYGISVIDGPQLFNERSIFEPMEIITLIACSGAYIGLLAIMVRAGFVSRHGERAR